jgi:hypothetical protein
MSQKRVASILVVAAVALATGFLVAGQAALTLQPGLVPGPGAGVQGSRRPARTPARGSLRCALRSASWRRLPCGRLRRKLQNRVADLRAHAGDPVTGQESR